MRPPEAPLEEVGFLFGGFSLRSQQDITIKDYLNFHAQSWPVKGKAVFELTNKCTRESELVISLRLDQK